MKNTAQPSAKHRAPGDKARQEQGALEHSATPLPAFNLPRSGIPTSRVPPRSQAAPAAPAAPSRLAA